MNPDEKVLPHSIHHYTITAVTRDHLEKILEAVKREDPTVTGHIIRHTLPYEASRVLGAATAFLEGQDQYLRWTLTRLDQLTSTHQDKIDAAMNLEETLYRHTCDVAAVHEEVRTFLRHQDLQAAAARRTPVRSPE